MITKKERLNKKAFNRSFSKGVRIHTSSLVCIYQKSNQQQVAVVVSKKIARRAVVRNKIRRRVYNGVRAVCAKEQCTGVYIFLVKKSILPKTYQEICAELQTVLAKVPK